MPRVRYRPPVPIDMHVAAAPAEALAAWLEPLARRAIAERGAFSLALPGGSVATTCFPRLATADVDWSGTHFFWGDERAVPPSHADSNFRAAEESWLAAIAERRPHVHRMEAERADLEAARDDYERTLRAVAPGGLDLALLGVGPDGHVCSLFAGHPLLDERARWVAAITDSPKPPPVRLTLTLPALRAARTVVVVALGAGKAEMIAAAVEDPTSALPVAMVLRGAKDARLLLDPPAARLLARAR